MEMTGTVLIHNMLVAADIEYPPKNAKSYFEWEIFYFKNN